VRQLLYVITLRSLSSSIFDRWTDVADKRVFKVSITKTMKHTKCNIPNIIKKTVKYIEE
jgi:hypothetical protein